MRSSSLWSILLLGCSSACSSSSEPNPPELPSNPQVWTAVSGDIVPPGSGGSIAFTPTKTIRVGSTLRTYFVRASDGKVVFAASVDGRSLANVTATNIQRTNAGGDLTTTLSHPTVMQRADGKFLMIYDYTYDTSKQHATRLVARVSDDGITWGSAVQLPATDADKNPDGVYFQGVTGLVTSGATIRAYYTTTGSRIGSAQSTDGGATWAQDPGYRLSGQAGYIDPTAIVDTDGSILLYFGYVLDFHCDAGGGTAQGCTPIRLARSTDGLTFSVYAGNVLTPANGPIDLQDPDIFIAPDGKWRMLFGEFSGSGPTAKLRLAERQ